jgi:hypothetical protein
MPYKPHNMDSGGRKANAYSPAGDCWGQDIYDIESGRTTPEAQRFLPDMRSSSAGREIRLL